MIKVSEYFVGRPNPVTGAIRHTLNITGEYTVAEFVRVILNWNGWGHVKVRDSLGNFIDGASYMNGIIEVPFTEALTILRKLNNDRCYVEFCALGDLKRVDYTLTV